MSAVLSGHFALDQALIRPFKEGKEEILASGRVFIFYFKNIYVTWFCVTTQMCD